MSKLKGPGPNPEHLCPTRTLSLEGLRAFLGTVTAFEPQVHAGSSSLRCILNPCVDITGFPWPHPAASANRSPVEVNDKALADFSTPGIFLCRDTVRVVFPRGISSRHGRRNVCLGAKVRSELRPNIMNVMLTDGHDCSQSRDGA